MCYYASQTYPGHAPTSVISTVQRFLFCLKKTHTGVQSHSWNSGTYSFMGLLHLKLLLCLDTHELTDTGCSSPMVRSFLLFHVCRFLLHVQTSRESLCVREQIIKKKDIIDILFCTQNRLEGHKASCCFQRRTGSRVNTLGSFNTNSH